MSSVQAMLDFFPENLHFVCFVTWNWLYRFMHLNMVIKSNLYRNEDSCSIQRFSRRILCRVLLQNPGRHLIQSSRSSSLAMITSAKRITVTVTCNDHICINMKQLQNDHWTSTPRSSTLQPTVGQSLWWGSKAATGRCSCRFSTKLEMIWPNEFCTDV